MVALCLFEILQRGPLADLQLLDDAVSYCTFDRAAPLNGS
jgi:hypothetical protein